MVIQVEVPSRPWICIQLELRRQSLTGFNVSSMHFPNPHFWIGCVCVGGVTVSLLFVLREAIDALISIKMNSQ